MNEESGFCTKNLPFLSALSDDASARLNTPAPSVTDLFNPTAEWPSVPWPRAVSSLLLGLKIPSSPGKSSLKPMLVLGLDGGGIRNFSRALESVDKEEPELAAAGLSKSVEKIRVTFVTEKRSYSSFSSPTDKFLTCWFDEHRRRSCYFTRRRSRSRLNKTL